MLLTFRRWLIASCLCSTFAFAPAALADSPSTSISRAVSESVKPSFETKRREARVLGLRLPTFLRFGLGKLSAARVATGFASRRGNDPISCDSRCTEQAATQRRLLVATGVLTGVAAAGVGIGFTLMLKAPKDPRRDAFRPRFDLGLSGQKAVAKIGWVF
ncbi:MAG TPA: hypothetical protein VJN18_02505 [Polyangiaceae bacterium]|nr:hypothetical protein [Polyangiaceae bacterium]